MNSRDYSERIPALVAAGTDLLCLDSSDGFSVWQRRTLEFARSAYGDAVPVGAGNIVDGRGFRYLAEAGAAFVKVGIGGGSICTTREQKGIGRGQASALLDVVRERDAYAAETGVYVPVCCDEVRAQGERDRQVVVGEQAAVLLGRYFARLDESPSRKVRVGGQLYKEYWSEDPTGPGTRPGTTSTRKGWRSPRAWTASSRTPEACTTTSRSRPRS
ncbi:MAG TPA: IMP dehydrogenase [Trebonia sp.]